MSYKQNEVRKKLLERIEYLYHSLNEPNWDNDGATPISLKAKIKAEEIVRATPPDILSHWNIFPSRSSSLSFEFKEREIAALALNSESFTYAAKNKKREVVKGKCTYEDMNPSDALTCMTNLLGYV